MGRSPRPKLPVIVRPDERDGTVWVARAHGNTARGLMGIGLSVAAASACSSGSMLTFHGSGAQQPTAPFVLAAGSVDAHWDVSMAPGGYCDFDAVVWPIRADAPSGARPVGDVSRETYVLVAAVDPSGSFSGDRSLQGVPGGTYVVFAGGDDGCGSWTVTLTSHPR